MALFEGTFDIFPIPMKRPSLLGSLLLIATLISLSLLLIALSNRYVLTQDFYDRNGEPLAGIPEIEAMAYRGIQRTIYFYAAIYLIIKLLLVTTVLYTGLFYFDMKASFRRILRVVACAEFIFLVPAAF